MSDHSQQTDRERILSKIQKCMRLSKSSNPGEAANALRQAQKLMQLHNVSEGELLGMEVLSKLVVTPEPYKRKMPMYMAYLVAIVQTAFDVQAVSKPAPNAKGTKYHMAIEYFGVNGKHELAAYAHEVIWRALTSSWKEYSRNNPWVANERGARQGFWIGWLQEVRAKVMAFGGSAEEKEMVTKAISSRYSSLTETKQNKMRINGETHGGGREAAADFSLHRPMTGKQEQYKQLTND